MKTWILMGTGLWLALTSSCSKKISATGLVGTWSLTKICVCDACMDTIGFYQTQTLVFSLTGQVDLYGAVGNALRHYSGTYQVTPQAYGRVLDIDLIAPDADKHFLFIPGSLINSESNTKLVLALNTPYANPCAYVNTYTAIPGR